MPRLRLTSTYSPEPGVTLHPGHRFDATDEQAERLLSLDGAVEVSEDDDTPDAARNHLAMLEDQHGRMLEEHETLKSGNHPERVIALSEGRIKAQDALLVKARERAGVKPARKVKPAEPVAPPVDPPAVK